MITDLKIKKKAFVVGPEYLTLALTSIVSAVTGGSWIANRMFSGQQERLRNTIKYITTQEKRIDSLEEQINRMPLEYVLKVDFLREIQIMHDNFNQINNKLDKLVEKLIDK